MKIAIQKGLDDISDMLKSLGHTVVPYRESGMDSNVAIINNIDAAYEEMEPIEVIRSGQGSMLVLNASQLTRDQVLEQVKKFKV